MNEQPVIIVNIGTPEWTLRAVHAACTLARSMDARLILLQLVFVNNPGFLGEPAAHWNFDLPARYAMSDYLNTVEDYGIEAEANICQCFTVSECLVENAYEMHAQVVFANLPEYRFHLWHHWQMWFLRRQLSQKHCQLISLEDTNSTVLAISLPKQITHSQHRIQ